MVPTSLAANAALGGLVVVGGIDFVGKLWARAWEGVRNEQVVEVNVRVDAEMGVDLRQGGSRFCYISYTQPSMTYIMRCRGVERTQRGKQYGAGLFAMGVTLLVCEWRNERR